MRRALALTMWTLEALTELELGGIEFAIDRVAGVARTQTARNRAAAVRRDHRQPDVDPALRFDGIARPRHDARTFARRTRNARRPQQARAR